MNAVRISLLLGLLAVVGSVGDGHPGGQPICRAAQPVSWRISQRGVVPLGVAGDAVDFAELGLEDFAHGVAGELFDEGEVGGDLIAGELVLHERL